MHSRRSRFESACSIAAFALLGWLLGGSIIRLSPRPVERMAACDKDLSDCEKNLSLRLSGLTRRLDGAAIHLGAPLAPAPWTTDWLAALARAGTSVSWSGSAPAVAIEAHAATGPRHDVHIDVAGPAGALVRLRDDAGDVDSTTIADLGATMVTPLIVGGLRAEVGGQRLTAPVPDTSVTRSVLVIGAAGWEGKYIVSALEERGWPVVARFAVAPGVDVTTGAAAQLDTNRFAAVIALDSTAERLGPALERFVRSGGGLVLAGIAPASRALSDLSAGALGERTRPKLAATDTMRLGSTGFYPVAQLRPGAVPIERRGDAIVLAARRIGAGRVLQAGYDDSWRWRMAGAAGSEEAHREWWSRVVRSVAYAPAHAASAADVADAAPLAYLAARLGPPRSAPPARGRGVDPRLIVTLIMILLLTEWASRRLRGLR